MKNLLILVSCLVLLSLFQCRKKEACCNIRANQFKAKFEIKGMCHNYTFSIIEGNRTDLVESKWTDPETKKTYTNAFGMTNPCELPENLKEGDEFYGEITAGSMGTCGTCAAFYPTPDKKISFRVLKIVEK